MDIQKALADIKAEKERRYVNCARLAHAIARATGEKRSDLERRLAEQHGILVGLAIAQNKLRRCAKQSTNGADGGSGAAEGGGCNGRQCGCWN